MSRVAAVIVTHHSEQVIGRCLESLCRFQGDFAEVIVVDNASRDQTRSEVEPFQPFARWVANRENRGFAAAVNQGVSLTSSPLVLLLNPDCVLETSIASMASECLSDNTAAVGGRLIGPDGQPQRGFNIRGFPTPGALAFEVLGVNRFWPANSINHRYRRMDWDPELPTVVEQPAGAFLLLRRDVLENLGGLDEQFHPIWFEDVDLCLRIRQAGMAIRYQPEAVAKHAGGHSIPSLPDLEKTQAWYGSLLRFSDKHFHPAVAGRLRWLILIGLLGRWLAALIQGGSAQERQSYACAAQGLLRRSLAAVVPEAYLPQPSSTVRSQTS